MSAAILFSSAGASFFSAKEVGHMAPSSRFAASSKPNVAYLDLNLSALLKKQTPLSSLAYAGIPYQVLGERLGALVVMISWSRSAMVRSAFRSWASSFSAARSSAVIPAVFVLVAVVLLAGRRVLFFAVLLSASTKHLLCARVPPGPGEARGRCRPGR